MACLCMDFPDSIEILHLFTQLTHFYARQTNSTIFFTYVTIQHTQQPQASECHHCLGEHLCYCGCCVQIIVSFQFRNLFYWNHNEILLSLSFRLELKTESWTSKEVFWLCFKMKTLLFSYVESKCLVSIIYLIQWNDELDKGILKHGNGHNVNVVW